MKKDSHIGKRYCSNGSNVTSNGMAGYRLTPTPLKGGCGGVTLYMLFILRIVVGGLYGKC